MYLVQINVNIVQINVVQIYVQLNSNKYVSAFTVNVYNTSSVGVYLIKLCNKESKKYERVLFVW